ncbi:hypothetical protein IC582_015298 [Cucumis melo]
MEEDLQKRATRLLLLLLSLFIYADFSFINKEKNDEEIMEFFKMTGGSIRWS